jgi:hypothetical protein
LRPTGLRVVVTRMLSLGQRHRNAAAADHAWFLYGFSRANANTAAAYAGVAQFTNTTRLTQLNPNFANPIGFATTLQNTFLANGVAAGSPANFFVVNPTVGLLGAGIQSVTLTTNDVDTWYDALQLEFRRRLSGGLLLQMSYTWSKSLSNFYASSQSSLGQPLTLRSDNKPLERFSRAAGSSSTASRPTGFMNFLLAAASGSWATRTD